MSCINPSCDCDCRGLVLRYQQIAAEAWARAGDILSKDDPAQAWSDRLEALLAVLINERGHRKQVMNSKCAVNRRHDGGNHFIGLGPHEPAGRILGEAPGLSSILETGPDDSGICHQHHVIQRLCKHCGCVYVEPMV